MTLILTSASPAWGADPQVVSCALEWPSGIIALYTYGTNAEVARTGLGTYSLATPIADTADSPYTTYWYGTGQTAATTTPTIASYKQTVLNDKPTLYWRLNETSGTTAADASGNSRTGTYATSNVTLNVAGATTDGDAAFQVTATTDAGAAGCGRSGSNGLTGGAAAFSVECWVKSPGFDANGDNLFNIPCTGADWFQVYISNSGADLTISCHALGAQIYTGLGTTLRDGNWHRMAVTWNASVMTLYTDGAIQTPSSGTIAGTPTISTSGAYVGGDSFPDRTAGYYDEFALYNYCLTAHQIAAHYSAR